MEAIGWRKRLLTWSTDKFSCTRSRYRYAPPVQVTRPADLNSLRLVRFGDVYVDEASGWTHVCNGEACDAQLRAADGSCLVCPVTGSVFQEIVQASGVDGDEDGGARGLSGHALADDGGAGADAAGARSVHAARWH